MVDIREFKRRLRGLRERFGLTQNDVAALAGIDYKFYQYIESPRKKQIWLETISRLAAVYRLELSAILPPKIFAFRPPPRDFASTDPWMSHRVSLPVYAAEIWRWATLKQTRVAGIGFNKER